jgi:hypothetical protein
LHFTEFLSRIDIIDIPVVRPDPLAAQQSHCGNFPHIVIAAYRLPEGAISQRACAEPSMGRGW